MPLAAHLTQLYLKAAATAVGAGDEVDGITKESIKINGEQLDTTDFKDTSGWHTYIQGLKGASVEISGQVEPGDGPQSLLRSSLLTYADLWCEIQRNPTGGSGLKGFRGQVMVESYSEDGDPSTVQTFSASLKFTGAVTAV
jgi:predicted secreted protein